MNKAVKYATAICSGVILLSSVSAQRTSTTKQTEGLLEIQTGTIYGKVFPNNPIFNSSVTGTAISLSRTNREEQSFLRALTAAAQKGTFICDNVNKLHVRKFTIDHGEFSMEVTSETWPVEEVLLIGGTVKLGHRAPSDRAEGEYEFASWGSTPALPYRVTQAPPLNVIYIESCPGSQYVCENKLPHAALPQAASRMAEAQGQQLNQDRAANGNEIDSIKSDIELRQSDIGANKYCE